MTQRVGSNRIANSSITLEKIASGVLDTAADAYSRSHSNAAFNTANASSSVANTAQNSATAAFLRANNSIDANNGGTITGDLNVTGNLYVSGNTFSIDVDTLRVDDPLLHLAANNESSDAVDIGFVGHYSDDGGSTKRHTGIFRDSSDSNRIYTLFDNYDDVNLDDANTHINIDTTDASFRVATLKANISTPHLSITGNTESAGYFAEKANIIASGLDANNTYLLTDGVVHYHTGTSSANANVSLTGFGEVGVGNAVSMVVIITNNVYKRYITTIQIDGTTSGVTTIWAGESKPTQGSANTDIYSFNVIKTAATPTYTVFASRNAFG